MVKVRARNRVKVVARIMFKFKLGYGMVIITSTLLGFGVAFRFGFR